MDWSSSLDKDLHDTTQTQSNLRDILQGYGRSQAAHQQRTKSNTPIPDDGLVGSDGRSVQLDGLGTAVQSHGALGDTNVNSSGTHLTILTELAGSDEGDGDEGDEQETASSGETARKVLQEQATGNTCKNKTHLALVTKGPVVPAAQQG